MKNIFIAALLLLLFSCERDTTIKLRPHTPSLVVHSYTEVGNIFEIAVGKSTNNTDISSITEDTYVNNATVVLYENGIVIDTLEYDPVLFRYRSDDTAFFSKTYKIIVEAPGFITVEATAIAPSSVGTTLVSYIRDARVDVNGTLLSDVTFRFTDPPAEANYYVAKLENEYHNSFCTYTYDPSIEQFQGNLNPFESGSCIRDYEILFTDKLFNGTVKDITLSVEKWGLDVIGGIKPWLKKYSISQDFYKYIKDGINVDIVEGNPFAEPTIEGGNIRNGYGLFTVYTMTVDTLR